MICYIGAGSNVGDRLKNIRDAVWTLNKKEGVAVRRTAPVYETEPQGGPGHQMDYYNTVLELECQLPARELLVTLQDIEKKIGRKPRPLRWSKREIDLDILLFDNQVIQEKDLEIPHPLMTQRYFVLKPLSDLAPHLAHPVFKKEVLSLLKSLKERGRVRKIEETVSGY